MSDKENESTQKLSTWWRKYRIVRDSYLGYEAQVWRIWFPIWIGTYFANTSSTIKNAEALCVHHANPVVKHL